MSHSHHIIFPSIRRDAPHPPRQPWLMATLIPSTSLPLPRTSALWHIFPRIDRRAASPRTARPLEERRMSDFAIDIDPPPPVQTGPEHWEAQRRRWTQGFSTRDIETVARIRFRLILGSAGRQIKGCFT